MRILAEGGYQPFHLSSAEWVWLIFAALCALTAIATGFILMRSVLASEQGTPSMIEIARAVQEGAQAYLMRQFRAIGIIVLPLTIVGLAPLSGSISFSSPSTSMTGLPISITMLPMYPSLQLSSTSCETAS